jgi:hypothetical protein
MPSLRAEIRAVDDTFFLSLPRHEDSPHMADFQGPNGLGLGRDCVGRRNSCRVKSNVGLFQSITVSRSQPVSPAGNSKRSGSLFDRVAEGSASILSALLADLPLISPPYGDDFSSA